MNNQQKTILYIKSKIDAFNAKERHFKQLNLLFDNLIFCQNEDDLLLHLPNTTTLITWLFKPHWYEIATNLKDIYTPAAGDDWIAKNDRIKIHHGHFQGKIMAESLLAMMLWHSRNLALLQQAQSKKQFARDLLSNTNRLGNAHHFILGYGAIGRACAKLLKAMGATITGIKRSCRNNQLDNNADFIIHPNQLDKHLHKADSLICILPSGDETKHIITKKHFTMMKSSAYLYNIGRGNCYQESNLIWALQNKQIAGAGLDVFEQEPLSQSNKLWDMSNVFIMPHTSAVNKYYLDDYIQELAINAK